MKYKNIPVEIEAIQWTGENIKEVSEFIKPEICNVMRGRELTVKTLEYTILIRVGDYIIREETGKTFRCKPEVFKERYLPIEEIKHEMTDIEAYEILKDNDKRVDYMNKYNLNYFEVRDRAEAIALDALKERIDTGWISIEDRPPKQYEMVLLGSEKWISSLAGVRDYDGRFSSNGADISPTHWMPMPKLTRKCTE